MSAHPEPTPVRPSTVGMPAQAITAASSVIGALDTEAAASTSSTDPTTTVVSNAQQQPTTSTSTIATANHSSVTAAAAGSVGAQTAATSAARLPFTGSRTWMVGLVGLFLILLGQLGRRRARSEGGRV